MYMVCFICIYYMLCFLYVNIIQLVDYELAGDANAAREICSSVWGQLQTDAVCCVVDDAWAAYA